MRTRSFVWAFWAVTVLLAAGALLLALTNRQGTLVFDFQSAIIAPTFSALGALIVVRRPGNMIGWIFLAAGVLVGVTMFSGQYAKTALVPDGPRLHGGALAAWCAAQTQSAYGFLVLFLVLLFPDGKPLSRRWRLVMWAIGMFLAGALVIGSLSPGPFVDFPSIRNPFGVEALAPVLDVLGIVGSVGGAVCVAVTIVSLILRFYRSRGEERLQLKWFTYAAAVGFPTPLILSEFVPAVFQLFGQLLWTLAFLSLPVSAGVAILKYRLYDIDLIINRTLVYGSLTGLLVFIYVGCVVGLQYILRFLTGGESQIVIVASTLLVAALFNPLRRRIQAFIDHRFYRGKYDAARTLEEFSARLRDETNLDELSSDLVVVVWETMQPEHASLWLRRSEGSSP